MEKNMQTTEVFKKKEWFKFVSTNANKKILLDIFGEILSYEMETLIKEINRSNATEIDIQINSPGGNTFSSFALYNTLRSHGARITTFNLGLAASAASLIFLAGDKRIVGDGALTMIHRASGMAFGNINEIQKTIQALASIDSQQAKLYGSIFSKPENEVMAWLDAETWFTSDELTTMGISEKSPVAARTCADFDFSTFKNAPLDLIKRINDEKNESINIKNEMEKRLKECSI